MPRPLLVHHAAVRVQEAREAHDVRARRAIGDEVDRLGDRDVHAALADLGDRIHVLLRLDELELYARLGEPALLLRDEEGHVIGVREPLEAEADAFHRLRRCALQERAASGASVVRGPAGAQRAPETKRTRPKREARWKLPSPRIGDHATPPLSCMA
jgi:hypothetical protein